MGAVQLEEAIRTRRTHKAFRAEPVPDTVLDELFELARWAPNHHVTNPWRFHVIGPQTRTELMELADRHAPGSAVKLARAPTLVAASARMSGDEEQDREDLLATAVAAYIVLLGAHARGLAGYWRSVPLLDAPDGRALLRLEPTASPVGLLYLGQAVEPQRVPPRAPVSDISRYLP